MAEVRAYAVAKASRIASTCSRTLGEVSPAVQCSSGRPYTRATAVASTTSSRIFVRAAFHADERAGSGP